MASAYATVAQALYVAYFGRPGDVAGISNIEAALAAADPAGVATTTTGLLAAYSTNPAIASIVDSFGTSKESQLLYGTNALDFVTTVFESLFNRAPAATGLLFWANAIVSGSCTAGEAALAIAAGAAPADQASITAKLTVATEFTTYMAGSSDDAEAYQGPEAAAAARSLLQGVTSSNYNSYATNAEVQNTLHNIVVPFGPWVGPSVNLTTGVDTLNLTGIYNHVTGTANGSGATLTAGDQIVGTASSMDNLLDLADLSTGGIWVAGAMSGVTISNIQNVQLISGEAVTINAASSVEGLTGLQYLDVNDVGGTDVTAALSTAVAAIDAKTAVATDASTGGSTVTVNANYVTTGSVVVSGAAGTVSVTTNEDTAAGDITTGGIIVHGGGTSIDVTANLAGAENLTVTGGTIAVTGSTATQSVSVAQSASATAGATVSGVIDGAVTVTDAAWDATPSNSKAGTIISVTLDNFASATINDNSLAILTVAGNNGTVTLDDNLPGSTASTLALYASGSAVSFSDANNEITTLNLTTTGTSASTITLADTGLRTLTLAGTQAVSVTLSEDSNGVTVSAGGDNADITVVLNGTKGAPHNDAITLGNGNDVVNIGASSTGAVVFGTGNDSIVEAAGDSLNVTFGAHSATTITDSVTVGAANTAKIAPSAVITGLNMNGSDTINFSGDANATGPLAIYTAAQITTFGNNPTTLAAAVAGVLSASGGNLAQHATATFQFEGNTYLVEQARTTGSAFASGDTLVELTGTQTLTMASNVVNGTLHLHG